MLKARRRIYPLRVAHWNRRGKVTHCGPQLLVNSGRHKAIDAPISLSRSTESFIRVTTYQVLVTMPQYI